MFSNSFVPLSFSHFSFYIHYYLGTLSSFLFIMQSMRFPQYLPQTLDPSRSPAQARVLYMMSPTLLRGQSGLELETFIYCSNIAPGSFSCLLFYFSFESESSSLSSGSRICYGLCQEDVATKVFLARGVSV